MRLICSAKAFVAKHQLNIDLMSLVDRISTNKSFESVRIIWRLEPAACLIPRPRRRSMRQLNSLKVLSMLKHAIRQHVLQKNQRQALSRIESRSQPIRRNWDICCEIRPQYIFIHKALPRIVSLNLWDNCYLPSDS